MKNRRDAVGPPNGPSRPSAGRRRPESADSGTTSGRRRKRGRQPPRAPGEPGSTCPAQAGRGGLATRRPRTATTAGSVAASESDSASRSAVASGFRNRASVRGGRSRCREARAGSHARTRSSTAQSRLGANPLYLPPGCGSGAGSGSASAQPNTSQRKPCLRSSIIMYRHGTRTRAIPVTNRTPKPETELPSEPATAPDSNAPG